MSITCVFGVEAEAGVVSPMVPLSDRQKPELDPTVRIEANTQCITVACCCNFSQRCPGQVFDIIAVRIQHGSEYVASYRDVPTPCASVLAMLNLLTL